MIPTTIPHATTSVESGEFIYVSGVSPTSRGSVAVETRSALDELRAALADAGSSLDGVVSVLVFIRAAADFQAMNEAYAGSGQRTFRRVRQSCARFHAGVMVEMSVVAVRTGAERRRASRQLGLVAEPYSYAMTSGDTVFLSGLVSRNGRDNSVVAGSVGSRRKSFWTTLESY
jgi:2-iminobutanoate/2-iminopropanoate deaminase